jgi:hypothetical protein
MYNLKVTTEITQLDGTSFAKNEQIWANLDYDGILFLQSIGLEGLRKLLEETAKKAKA